jgi:hypothetical protein
LKSAWLADVVDDSSKDGVLNHGAFEAKLRTMGPDALREMFTPEELARIDAIGDIGRTVQSGGTTGTMLVGSMLQLGGGYKLYRGITEGDYVDIGKGGFWFFGPSAYARLIMNPRGAALLAKGFSIKPGPGATEAMAAIGAKAVKLLTSEDNRELAIKRKEAAAGETSQWNVDNPNEVQARNAVLQIGR